MFGFFNLNKPHLCYLLPSSLIFINSVTGWKFGTFLVLGVRAIIMWVLDCLRICSKIAPIQKAQSSNRLQSATAPLGCSGGWRRLPDWVHGMPVWLSTPAPRGWWGYSHRIVFHAPSCKYLANPTCTRLPSQVLGCPPGAPGGDASTQILIWLGLPVYNAQIQAVCGWALPREVWVESGWERVTLCWLLYMFVRYLFVLQLRHDILSGK